MNIEEQAYKKIIDNLYGGLYFVDRNRVITYWNTGAERITGFSADEVVGSSCADNILTHIDAEGNQLCLGLCPLAHSMEDGETREADVFLHHKDGHRVPVSVRISVLRNDQGEIIGGIELFTDNSQGEVAKSRMKALEALALQDKLTKLANRAFVEDELKKCFDEKQAFGLSFGLLFMDVDNFKQFNDTYGHNVGDEVLQLVAKTFTANTRPFDLYGRWGGEEFIAVFRNVKEAELKQLGNRIRLLVANSYIVHGNEKLSVTISLGGSVAKDNDTSDGLLKRIDNLLYQSKKAGRNCLSME